MLFRSGLLTKAFFLAVLVFVGKGIGFGADTGEIGELSGAIGITLDAGSPEVPFYKVASAGLKSEAAFRGQIKGIIDNNVTFNRLPDLLDPTKLAWPFADGIFSTLPAWATAEVNNGKVTAITIGSPGFGYLKPPEICIHPPDTGSDVTTNSINATAVAEINGTRLTDRKTVA